MLTPTTPNTTSIQNTHPVSDSSRVLASAIPYTTASDQSPPPDGARRRSRLFIKGPIPFSWLQQANGLGGSTGIVASALWFYVGLHKSRRFRIDQRLDQLCCLTRQTRNLILERLQRHGLIVVHPKRGAYPTIEVRDTCG